MKLKDLVIGTEYLANSTNDWLDNNWSNRRVRVVSAEVSWYFWKNGQLIKTDHKPSTLFGGGKKGVLVDVLHEKTGAFLEQRCVPLTQIKGTWEAAILEQAAHKAKTDQLREQALREIQETDNRFGILIAKALGAFGLSTYKVRRPYGDGHSTCVLVNVDVFEQMVATLEAQGWKYEEKKK